MFVVDDGALFRFFVRSFLLGVLLACVYLIAGMIYLSVKRTFKGRLAALIVFILDFSFCMISAFCGILLIFSANSGQVRIAAIVSWAIGFFAVYRLLRRPVHAAENALLDLIVSAFIAPVARVLRKIGAACTAKRRRAAEKRFDRTIDRKLAATAVKRVEKLFDGLIGQSSADFKNQGR